MPIVELLALFAIPDTNGTDELVYAAFPDQLLNYGFFVGAWLLIIVFGLLSFSTATIAVDVDGIFG